MTAGGTGADGSVNSLFGFIGTVRITWNVGHSSFLQKTCNKKRKKEEKKRKKEEEKTAGK